MKIEIGKLSPGLTCTARLVTESAEERGHLKELAQLNLVKPAAWWENDELSVALIQLTPPEKMKE